MENKTELFQSFYKEALNVAKDNLHLLCKMYALSQVALAEKSVKNINRVEVIERGKGRVYTNWNASNVSISMQDEGRTLKVFVGYKEEE